MCRKAAVCHRHAGDILETYRLSNTDIFGLSLSRLYSHSVGLSWTVPVRSPFNLVYVLQWSLLLIPSLQQTNLSKVFNKVIPQGLGEGGLSSCSRRPFLRSSKTARRSWGRRMKRRVYPSRIESVKCAFSVWA